MQREDLGQMARKVGWDVDQGMTAAQLVEFCGIVAERIKSLERLAKHGTALLNAGKRVLSDIDDDGVAERHDVAVQALRDAVSKANTDFA